jgi:UDP-N-acetylglucosamine--N-acetylmuramyl-(pentapeptide) pyrophosphoryl-undecaprenol N-acetylglucosamine transferase
MSKEKSILFTGGGTAGHVTVNLALMPRFLQEGWRVSYIGSHDGIERQLVDEVEPKVPYMAISTGKLRRYFDWKNFKDPFKVLKGVWQAYFAIRKVKPDVIFSKGGFVTVPVVLGAWLNRVPVMIHESDITPGLANKIAIPFASKICTTFPETKKHLQSPKAEYVGAIVREELKQGDAARGYERCGFTADKSVLLIMGGSLGSQKINGLVREHLPELLQTYQIVHICGKGQVDPTYEQSGYRQFEYINQELPDVLSMADLVVSRAGSNSIFEFLSLQKPMLLIPLSRAASRGDQILNANSFQKMGYCEVLEEEELSSDTFLGALAQLHEQRDAYIEKMRQSTAVKSLDEVMELIRGHAR